MRGTIASEREAEAMKAKIAEIAIGLLNGQRRYVDESQQLVGLLRILGVAETDPDLRAFDSIDSETHNLPLGSARQYWSLAALKRHEPEVEAVEQWARNSGGAASASLLQWFQG